MERIRNLDAYQKVLLVLMAVMLLVFTVLYAVVTFRVGFEYMDTILVPRKEDGSTVYSGTIKRQQTVFTVTQDKAVTFRYGNKVYGPYTAKEDPSAIPKEEAAHLMTGIELYDGNSLRFRGGVLPYGDGDFMLYDEDGSLSGVLISFTASNGTVLDADGNVVDPMEPSVSTILKLMDGPQLTSKGHWLLWFMGVFCLAATAGSMLFAEELFHHNMSFYVRDPELAEPSDWELGRRVLGWILVPILAFVCFITGLQ